MRRFEVALSASWREVVSQLCSATLVTTALIVVDMPGGLFGARDVMTPLGWALVALSWLGVLWSVYQTRRGEGEPSVISPWLFALYSGAFLPALVTDPLVAGLVVCWHLVGLMTRLSRPERASRVATLPDLQLMQAARATWSAQLQLSAAALLVPVVMLGYALSQHGAVVLLGGLLQGVATFSSWAVLREVLGRWSWRLLVGAGAVACVALLWPGGALGLVAVGLYHGVVLWALLSRGALFQELMAWFYHAPAQLIVAGFGGVAALGAGLLMFPAASATGQPVALLDALFTSVSAVCVTGLIVLDTPVAFSTFGHAILLALIQVGGLGIMVLSTFATLLLGGRLGLRGEQALGAMLDLRAPQAAYKLARFIVLSTLLIEGAGALVLAWRFAVALDVSVGRALWLGVFHAISAFCNAGFALQSDSVMLFQGDAIALMTLNVLITAGGLGFLVMSGLWQWARTRDKRQITLQTRIVLWMSLALVLLGWLLFLGGEWGASLRGLSAWERVNNALFQSVTLRTAGFNSVDFAQLRPATIMAMLAFMLVGASPGGTGGGVKTTTVAVLLGGLLASVRGESRVVMFKRELRQEVVYRSAAIVVISLLLAGLALFLLLWVEQQPFEVLAFEVISAIATVGLSLGATSKLTVAGKVIITVVMFIGRIGPLTLALLLGGRRPGRVDYPRAELMVG